LLRIARKLLAIAERIDVIAGNLVTRSEIAAAARAKCEAVNTTAARQHWRDQPALMEFLRAL